MQDLLISSKNFDVLHNYHRTLNALPQQAQRIKQQLDIGADPRFLQVYQPALEQTLWLLDLRLKQWPDLVAIYPRSFDAQQKLNADIRRFNEIFEDTIAKLPRDQRQDFLGKLDLRQLPFVLEGKLVVLKVGPAWTFAQQMKSEVSQTWMAFERGAGIMNNLHLNNREFLPRYVDFMKGAVETYINKHKLDRVKGDAKTASVYAEISKIEQQQEALAFATEQLSEGFSRLVKMQGAALNEFNTLFSSISVTDFQLMVELAIAYLDEAEKMARE